LGIPLLFWSAINIARLLYFGDLLPNTALVQDKASLAGLKAIGLFGFYTIAGFIAFYLLRVRSNKKSRRWFWLAACLACLGFSSSLVFQSGKIATEDLNPSQIHFLAISSMSCVVAATKWMHTKDEIDNQDLDAVFFALVLAPISQFVVMGEARLEPVRVLSLAVPWLSLWISVSIAEGFPYRAIQSALTEKILAFTLLSAGSFGIAFSGILDKPRDLPWVISPSEDRIIAAAKVFKRQHLLEGQLPLIASPDLGKLSFAKKGMIIDLGWLGDPLLARINKRRSDLESLYLNHVAKPDIVQTHEYWSCRYDKWLTSKPFKAGYILADPSMALVGNPWDTKCALGARYAIWLRRPDSAEYQLTRQIAKSVNPALVVREAIEECAGDGPSPFRCAMVVRSIQRNRLRLKRHGQLQQTINELRNSPSYEFDAAVLLRYPNWGERAFQSFVRLADTVDPAELHS
jgi:hypothetical protein